MKGCLPLLLFCSSLQAQGVGRVDPHGAFLPTDALARIGRLGPAGFHQGPVVSLAYSPDGKWLASASRDGIIRIWEPGSSLLLQQLTFDLPMAIAFSPDGQALAAAGQQGTVQAWDIRTGRVRFRARANTNRRVLRAICFSPDGKFLATAGEDHRARLWSSEDGRPLRELWDFTGEVGDVGFSPDGQRVVLAARAISLWNPNGTRIRSTGRGCPADTVAVSPDGKTLAAGHVGGAILLLDAVTLAERRRLDGPKGPPSRLAFSADGQVLAAAGTDGSLRVFRLDEKQPLMLPDVLGEENAMALSPDGRTVAHCGKANRVVLRDTRTGKQREFAGQSPDLEGKETVTGVTASRTRVFSARADGQFLAGNPATGKILFPVGRGVGKSPCLTLSPDGKLLAWTDAEEHVHVCEAGSGKELHVLREVDRPRTLSFSPDGRTLAVGSVRGNSTYSRVRLYQMPDGRRLHQFDVPSTDKPAVAFPPDGNTLLVVTEFYGVGVWEQKSRKLLSFRPGDGSRVLLTLSADGTRLAVRSRYGVELWDPTRNELLDIVESGTAAKAAAFSPDGRLVLTADGFKVRLRELATRNEVLFYEGHGGAIHSLAFLGGSGQAVSGGDDGTALVWDLTGRTSGRLAGGPLTEGEFDRLWTDLANREAPDGQAAVWRLATAKGAAARLRDLMLAGNEPAEVRRLIAQLEDRRFPVREQARRILTLLGPAAEKELRASLAEKPSLEVRRRVEELLKAGPVAEHRFRDDRVLQALEYSGSREARGLIATLRTKARSEEIRQAADLALKRIARSE